MNNKLIVSELMRSESSLRLVIQMGFLAAFADGVIEREEVEVIKHWIDGLGSDEILKKSRVIINETAVDILNGQIELDVLIDSLRSLNSDVIKAQVSELVEKVVAADGVVDDSEEAFIILIREAIEYGV